MSENENNWKEDVIRNKLGGKSEWSDRERMELCHQLDKDLENSLKSSSGKKVLQDKWTEENWREKMSEHPLFSPYLQSGNNEVEAPINELSEGLAQLKYDPEHNSPSEIAQNYKEEGVFYFKVKKYQNAIASFTEGIKIKCPENNLNAQLYNNRAAAHIYLGNYKTSLIDCYKAIDLKPGYMKAFDRAVECASKLKDWEKVIKLCNEVLLIEPSDEKYKNRLTSAVSEKKKVEAEKRKNAAAERKLIKLQKKLLLEITNRCIQVLPSEVENDEPSSLICHLQPQIKSLGNSMVYLNEENELIWPVLFLYPEHGETDSILEFNENTRFIDHFEQMFGQNNSPVPWDLEAKYKPKNLGVYYLFFSSKLLIHVSSSYTLKEVCLKKKLEVINGTFSFIILVEGSEFQKNYVREYAFKDCF